MSYVDHLRSISFLRWFRGLLVFGWVLFHTFSSRDGLICTVCCGCDVFIRYDLYRLLLVREEFKRCIGIICCLCVKCSCGISVSLAVCMGSIFILCCLCDKCSCGLSVSFGWCVFMDDVFIRCICGIWCLYVKCSCGVSILASVHLYHLLCMWPVHTVYLCHFLVVCEVLIRCIFTIYCLWMQCSYGVSVSPAVFLEVLYGFICIISYLCM